MIFGGWDSRDGRGVSYYSALSMPEERATAAEGVLPVIPPKPYCGGRGAITQCGSCLLYYFSPYSHHHIIIILIAHKTVTIAVAD